MRAALHPPRARSEPNSWVYPAAAIVVCMAGLIARLWQLGQAPNTLNADELVAIRLAGRIFVGHGPGVLALDANGQLAISGYLQAFGLRLLGDQAWVLRLPAALLGAAALPCFLLVARQLVRPWPALGATVLYGSSIYSLSVARSGWTNDFAAPLELLAIWLMLRSLTSERRALPLASGMACALAAYGYAPFRLLAAGMAPVLLLVGGADTHNRARRARRWVVGYAPLVCPLVIALAMQHDALRGYIAFHQINSRLPEYPPHTAAAWILARQAWAVVVGLVLLVPGQVANLDLEHVPAGRWLLDGPAIALYWLGLWRLAGYRAFDRGDPLRRTGALWAWMLVGQVVLAEVLVRDSPSLHPAMAAYPVYLLVCAQGLDYLGRIPFRGRWLLPAALVLVSLIDSGRAYTGWVNSTAAMQARRLSGAPFCIPSPRLLRGPCQGGDDPIPRYRP
ncbi:MAG TPA: glycosyltransferase family 39 protein [Chloroflexota bacterium]|nr:glycosyltransferase family 39 protein [Chloroflexota bacterium]